MHVLERQVTVLAENQNNNDDRYTRSKEENAALQARLIMLEEQVRSQRPGCWPLCWFSVVCA